MIGRVSSTSVARRVGSARAGRASQGKGGALASARRAQRAASIRDTGLIRQLECATGCMPGGLAKTKDRQEGFVDAPLLFRADPADQLAELAGIDCSDLLDQHSGRFAEQIDLWAE